MRQTTLKGVGALIFLCNATAGHDLVEPSSALSIMAFTCSGVNRCMSFEALEASLGSSSGESALLT